MNNDVFYSLKMKQRTHCGQVKTINKTASQLAFVKCV